MTPPTAPTGRLSCRWRRRRRGRGRVPGRRGRGSRHPVVHRAPARAANRRRSGQTVSRIALQRPERHRPRWETEVIMTTSPARVPAGHDSPGGRPRVVIIGSGFGGLFAAQALRKAPVDVTLVAKTTHHLFQPLLYQVATGILSEGEIAPPTREILRRQPNARVVLGEVTDIDLAAHTVTSTVLGRTNVHPYDELIVAAGAGQSYFGNDRFAEFAPGMKSIDDALELRGRIFGAFELAEIAEDQAEIDRLLTFVVVGAGPTGVEMAGPDRRARPPHPAPRLPPHRPDQRTGRPARRRPLRAALLRREARRRAPAGSSTTSASRCSSARWSPTSTPTGSRSRTPTGRSAASTPPPRSGPPASRPAALGRMLGEQSGAEVDRAGRVAVLPDLTLPGHPEVHVVGDMMALDKLPGVAQVAIQGGRYAADQIQRRLAGKPPREPLRVPRQGLDGDDLAVLRRRRDRQAEVRGLPRLGDVAGRAPLLHRGLQEPAHHRAALAGQLPGPRPLPAGRHPAAGLRPAGARASRPRLRGVQDRRPQGRRRGEDATGRESA